MYNKTILLTNISLICAFLFALLPSFAAKKVDILPLKTTTIEGSIIDETQNKLIIPSAKKLKIPNEIRIKAKNEKKELIIRLKGRFNSKGDLEIDLNSLGLNKMLHNNEYIAATKLGRKKLISQFSYTSPIILTGIAEIPVPYNEKFEASENLHIPNALITILDANTQKNIEGTKGIIVPGNLILYEKNNKKLALYRYRIIAELPSKSIKNLSSIEVKAHIQATTTNGIKEITLSNIEEINKNKISASNIISGIKIDPSTTITTKILEATNQNILKVTGKNTLLPNNIEIKKEVKNIFQDINHTQTIDESIEESKKIIANNSLKLYKILLQYVKSSPSITSDEMAKEITANISFVPSIANEKINIKESNILSLVNIYKSPKGRNILIKNFIE